MSRRRVSKLVAALCGLAVVAVLVLTSVYWRDLRVRCFRNRVLAPRS